MNPEEKGKNRKILFSAVENEDNINNVLNDDCLLLVFNLLSVRDKMNIEMVCKRWNSLSNSIWTGLKELDINVVFFCKNLKKLKFKRQKTLFVISILKKIGNYVTTLSIDNESISDLFKYQINFSQVLFELPKHCKNITNLSLLDSDFEHSMIDDKNLESIFINNKKLKSISLKHSCVQGICLLKLNANDIEEINLDQCEFSSNNYLYKFLKKCKNVKSFEFKASKYNETDEVIAALDALNMSECEGLLKFSFDCKPLYDFNFELLNLKFFHRQRKLRHFALKGLCIDKESEKFINCLPDSLEILEIQTYENLPKFVCRFSNLVSLKLEIVKDLNDACIETLTNFINLKELDISCWLEYLLTPTGESYFSKLENLEIFSLNYKSQKNIDNILIALTECKKLMNISISDIEFTKIGLESISLLPKLESLNVSFTNIREKDLIDFVRQSLNLRKLEIAFCQNISNEFLEAAYYIKKKRNDSHVLEISCAETKIIPQEFKNLSPLIQLDQELDF